MVQWSAQLETHIFDIWRVYVLLRYNPIARFITILLRCLTPICEGRNFLASS